MPGGRWTEADLESYDGYQNRGHIKELWRESFDPDDGSWTEFQELLHTNEDYKKIMDFIKSEDEDVAKLLEEKNPDNLEML